MRLGTAGLLMLLGALPATAQSPTVSPAFTSAGAFAGISVPDIEASITWYVQRLGLKLSMRPPAQNGVQVAILEGGGLIVELIQDPSAVPLTEVAPARHTTQVHGVFKAGIIVDDYEGVLGVLRDRSIPIAFGPFPAQEGQRANFIIRDNAGNLLQFLAR